MNTGKKPSVNVFVPLTPKDHATYLTALAEGYPGAKVLPLDGGYAECDIAVVFGVGKRAVPDSHKRGAIIYEHRFREKKPVVIVERGFIHRDIHYGVALNGLNGLGYFGGDNNPSDRWKALGVDIKPWRTGDYILVCGQVPWDASVQHTDHVAWCRDTVELIQSKTDRPVRFRAHPDVKDYDYGVQASKSSWEDDLAGAHAVVTFSSTSSAMAVLEGVPIFTMDPGSIAFGIGNKEITEALLENPGKYSRKQWAYDLAYSQWTVDEMRQGLPWERIL